MRKVLSIIVAILLVIAVMGLILFWPRYQGPVYDGKPVGYWLAHPTTNQNAGNKASLASGGGGGRVLNFPKFDSNAVPYIADALARDDGSLKRLYMRTREKSPPWVRRSTPELVPAQTVKRNALIALGQMGPEAKPAIPALLHIIQQDDDFIISLAAVVNLEHFGVRDKEVQNALLVATRSTNPVVSKYAIDALRRGDYQVPEPTRSR